MSTFLDQVKKGWNAFKDRDSPKTPDSYYYQPVELGYGSSSRPDRTQYSRSAERTFGVSIFNRLAIDCAAVPIRHVILDESGRYFEDADSYLNRCLTRSANKDQASRAFFHDVYASLFDEGSIAIVPTETNRNIKSSLDFDIYSLRVGKIVSWYPDNVKVNLYNDKTGQREDIMLPKATVAIVENPFYAVMNNPSSTTRRLLRKLSILDNITEKTNDDKLNMLIRLPYSLQGEMRKKQAEDRIQTIEDQLAKSKHGIGFIDATEQVIQMNRPLENNIMEQVDYLTKLGYSELGVSEAVLNNTASEAEMNNYYNRIIEPPIAAVVEAMKKAWLESDAAINNRESIMWFNDPFRIVSATAMGTLADQYTRNEVMSTNEIRQKIGMKPVDDPAADELRNKNLNAAPEQEFASTTEEGGTEDYEQV